MAPTSREKYTDPELVIMVNHVHKGLTSPLTAFRADALAASGLRLWERLENEQNDVIRPRGLPCCNHSYQSMQSKYTKYLFNKMHQVVGVDARKVLYIYRALKTTFGGDAQRCMRRVFRQYTIAFSPSGVVCDYQLKDVSSPRRAEKKGNKEEEEEEDEDEDEEDIFDLSARPTPPIRQQQQQQDATDADDDNDQDESMEPFPDSMGWGQWPLGWGADPEAIARLPGPSGRRSTANQHPPDPPRSPDGISRARSTRRVRGTDSEDDDDSSIFGTSPRRATRSSTVKKEELSARQKNTQDRMGREQLTPFREKRQIGGGRGGDSDGDKERKKKVDKDRNDRRRRDEEVEKKKSDDGVKNDKKNGDKIKDQTTKSQRSKHKKNDGDEGSDGSDSDFFDRQLEDEARAWTRRPANTQEREKATKRQSAEGGFIRGDGDAAKKKKKTAVVPDANSDSKSASATQPKRAPIVQEDPHRFVEYVQSTQDIEDEVNEREGTLARAYTGYGDTLDPALFVPDEKEDDHENEVTMIERQAPTTNTTAHQASVPVSRVNKAVQATVSSRTVGAGPATVSTRTVGAGPDTVSARAVGTRPATVRLTVDQRHELTRRRLLANRDIMEWGDDDGTLRALEGLSRAVPKPDEIDDGNLESFLNAEPLDYDEIMKAENKRKPIVVVKIEEEEDKKKKKVKDETKKMNFEQKLSKIFDEETKEIMGETSIQTTETEWIDLFSSSLRGTQSEKDDEMQGIRGIVTDTIEIIREQGGEEAASHHHSLCRMLVMVRAKHAFGVVAADYSDET